MNPETGNVSDLFALKARGSISAQLLARMKLMKENKVRLGRFYFVFLLATWVPIAILSLIEGNFFGDPGFAFLTDPGVHFRFLAAVPILLFSGPIVGMMVSVVIEYATNNLLTKKEFEEIWKPASEKVESLANSKFVVLVIAVVVVVLTSVNFGTAASMQLKPGQHSWIARSGEGINLTMAGWWYLLVGTPVIQVILGRWLWRFGIWCWLLAKLASAKLRCVATHPDKSGGLGILMGTQTTFTIVFFAINLTLSGSLTSQVLRGDITFEAARTDLIIAIALSVVIILFPLLFFIGDLAQTKRRALIEYGRLGTEVGRAFHSRWIQSDGETYSELMSEIDPSMMTDYVTTYQAAAAMRPVPFGIRDVAAIVIILGIAYIPVFLTRMSFGDILARLLSLVA